MKALLVCLAITLSLVQCRNGEKHQSIDTTVEDVVLSIEITDETDGKKVLAAFSFIDISTVKRVAMAKNIVQCIMRCEKGKIESNVKQLRAHKKVEIVKVLL